MDILEWSWRLRKLRRSQRARFLFDELTMDVGEQTLQRAIATISQSDPVVKLLEQVKLGRMKPTDAGLQAITESWLKTYQKVLESTGLSRQALRQIDPTPRVAVLIEAGVLTKDHRAAESLQATFEKALLQSPA